MVGFAMREAIPWTEPAYSKVRKLLNLIRIELSKRAQTLATWNDRHYSANRIAWRIGCQSVR